MSLILNIDTALETAFACIARDGKIISQTENSQQKDHASWLHMAVNTILNDAGKEITDIKAVAVNAGPGSYTGLRVGMAAAKGFCYAMNIPLITVSSLKLIAYAVQDEEGDFICPLIDARRMEVYTAVFDKTLSEIKPAHALVVEPNSFDSLLQQGKVLFCGNAVAKVSSIIGHHNAMFSETKYGASHLAALSSQQYSKEEFADLAYAEPFYVKEFYSPAKS